MVINFCVGLCAITLLVHFSSTKDHLLQMSTLTVWLNMWERNLQSSRWCSPHWRLMFVGSTIKHFQMLVWKGWTYTVASTFTSYDKDFHLRAEVIKIRDITELKLKITDIIASKTWQEIQYCLDRFCANKGACIGFKN